MAYSDCIEEITATVLHLGGEGEAPAEPREGETPAEPLSVVFTAVVDATPPEGMIFVNANTPYTASLAVILSLRGVRLDCW